jgi:AraC family transcriptional regulator of adaptative response / DNA-3-methyladenine glycosylase II
VGDRHLRRLFAEHLGTSPHAVAASRRAHFARALLDARGLSIAEVAHASGFGSVRQFNQTMRALFRRTPRELRRGAHEPGADGGAIRLKLAYRPPLAWRALLEFLGARAAPGVELVDGERYARTVSIGGRAGLLEARPATPGAIALTLRGPAVGAAGARAGGGQLLELSRRARRLFDLDADPLAIAAGLAGQPLLAPSLATRPGLRVPGAWDPFEALVRAILGQQVSVRAATTLAGRLVERFGAPIDPRLAGGGLTHLYPTAAALAEADVRTIGLPRARAESLRAAAARVAREPSLLEPAASLEEAVARLAALPGVGPWTAHYVALRALGEPDAFPSSDLGLRRASGAASPDELERAAARWRPWRAYATLHLWTMHAEESDGDRASAG